MSQKKAVDAWNKRYPQLAIGPKAADDPQLDELRQRAEGLTWTG